MVGLTIEPQKQHSARQATDSAFAAVRFAGDPVVSPVITITDQGISHAIGQSRQLKLLAENIYQQLSHYPYYSLVRAEERGCDNGITRRLLESVCHTVYRLKQKRLPHRSKVSFTRVCVNPHETHQRGQVTRLSRTHHEMRLHTDSSYDQTPHALLLFQTMHGDLSGGLSRLMPIDDVIKGLSDSAIDVLSNSRFPFARRTYPVLSEVENKPMIRYYREQMELRGMLDGSKLDAINDLDGVLKNREKQIQLRLQEGDLLFLNNHRILHGRTGFNSNSKRLLHRYRVELPTL